MLSYCSAIQVVSVEQSRSDVSVGAVLSYCISVQVVGAVELRSELLGVELNIVPCVLEFVVVPGTLIVLP